MPFGFEMNIFLFREGDWEAWIDPICSTRILTRGSLLDIGARRAEQTSGRRGAARQRRGERRNGVKSGSSWSHALQNKYKSVLNLLLYRVDETCCLPSESVCSLRVACAGSTVNVQTQEAWSSRCYECCRG
jgi:hypothetical protein